MDFQLAHRVLVSLCEEHHGLGGPVRRVQQPLPRWVLPDGGQHAPVQQ